METISNYNVLTADDELLQLKSLNNMIQSLDMGFNVQCSVQNGEDAINCLNNNVIHLIVSDIRMPVISGLDILQHVNNKHLEIPVILFSSYSEFEYAHQALKLGALDYVLKPLSHEKVENMLIKAEFKLSSYYKLITQDTMSGQTTKNVIYYAKNYIENNYSQQINMSELANKFGFSSSYLTKLFHKYEKCSPSKYLIDIRINIAKDLLINTDMMINEIGRAVGYENQFYFSRIFKNATSLTPTEYRDKNKDS